MLCLLLVGRKEEREKRKREMARGAFFPRAGHTLLAVPHGFSWLLYAI
jgi:hypothetical protein